MENKPTNLEDLFEKLKEYADTRINLFKLKAYKKFQGLCHLYSQSCFGYSFKCSITLCYYRCGAVNRMLAW